MSRPATRVLTLLEVLQDRGLVAAAELARRLEVEPRSVRRYVAALRELGIPVESVRGRYGGYRLARGYRLPPLMLGDDEAVATAVALAAAGEREDTPEGEAAGVRAGVGEPSPTDRALVKLVRVLPAPLRHRVDALVATTGRVADRPAVTVPDPEVALTLAAAVRSRTRVRIDHARPGGEAAGREVDPYGLVVHNRRWYLVGHDHLRDGLRTFRLDRIAAAAEVHRRFTPPEGFDPVAHVRHALNVAVWRHRTEVWLDADAAAVRRRLPATVGEVHPHPGGGSVLVSGADDLAGMARLLAGLPWPFTVLRPAALAGEVEAHVTRLAAAVERSRAAAG
ncbi:MAG TPA: YafY family protein [Acidimicrobiales bacterium]